MEAEEKLPKDALEVRNLATNYHALWARSRNFLCLWVTRQALKSALTRMRDILTASSSCRFLPRPDE